MFLIEVQIGSPWLLLRSFLLTCRKDRKKVETDHCREISSFNTNTLMGFRMFMQYYRHLGYSISLFFSGFCRVEPKKLVENTQFFLVNMDDSTRFFWRSGDKIVRQLWNVYSKSTVVFDWYYLIRWQNQVDYRVTTRFLFWAIMDEITRFFAKNIWQKGPSHPLRSCQFLSVHVMQNLFFLVRSCHAKPFFLF